MNSNESMDSRGLARRKMMIGAGALAVGSALGSLGGFSNAVMAAGGPTEKWPWPYVKLDPAKTADLAYNEWYRVFCGAAVISSVISQLREKVGEPYKSFPVDSFVFLEGGMAGWGTICGSNAGANIVANLIIGPRIAGAHEGHQIGADMLQWYSDTPLPVYTPKQPKIQAEIIKTTSESPLCHVSVGKWMKAADKPLGSPERRDRCARVTASVAYQLVELLNAWHAGSYTPTSDFAPGKEFGITGQPNCMDCHGSDVPTPPLVKS